MRSRSIAGVARRPGHPLCRFFLAWLAALVLVTVRAPTASAASPRGGDDKGVIDLGELVVEGKIQKPQVFYVLGRHAFTYRGLALQRSFVKRILSDARKNPF